MSKKVLSFGELLLRICPDGNGDWLKENVLPFYIGGAEANVATALALWGTPSAYFTAMPDNLLCRQVAGYLEEKGVDMSRVQYGGERLGLYFLPTGKDMKNAGVIYDRAHSSFASLKPGMVDWDAVLQDVGWLHFSAISPALNLQVAKVTEELLKAASERKGLTISVDLNYRAKLWQYGSAPTDIMPELVQYCDFVMGNLWAAEKMLGIPVDGSVIAEGDKKGYLEHAQMTSERIIEQFPRVKHVANTFRFDHGVGGIQYYTAFFTEGRLHHSKEYVSEKILDKVGSGDCFMGGLIHGLLAGKPVQETLEFATAAAYQKLFIPSDATHQRAHEIEKFMASYEG
ncbi:MAG: sugar kinase [Bacteroidetes bacterium]|nr:sugar kinase [Bacteroidota bacterium]